MGSQLFNSFIADNVLDLIPLIYIARTIPLLWVCDATDITMEFSLVNWITLLSASSEQALSSSYKLS